MQYFYEILDQFNSIHGKSILLNERKGGLVIQKGNSARDVLNIDKEGADVAGFLAKHGLTQQDVQRFRSQVKGTGKSKATVVKASPNPQKPNEPPADFKIWLAATDDTGGSHGQDKKPEDKKTEQNKADAPEEEQKNNTVVPLEPPFIDINLGTSFLQENLKPFLSFLQEKYQKSVGDVKRRINGYKEKLEREDLVNKIFGKGRNSLEDRLNNSEVVGLNEEGLIDTERKISAKEYKELAKQIWLKFFETLNKPSLDEDDLSYLKKKVRIQGSGDHKKFVLDSEDGQFRMSLSFRGSVRTVADLGLQKIIALTAGLPEEQRITQYERNTLGDDFSAVLGGMMEKLATNRVRYYSLKSKTDKCKNKNPKLCQLLEAQLKQAEGNYRDIISKLKKSCASLAEKLEAQDLVGNPEMVQLIDDLRNQLQKIETGDDKEDEKLFNIAVVATSMVEKRAVIRNADWSFVTGNKRGDRRKPDIASVFFKKSTAELAQRETAEKFVSYKISDKRLASVFEKGELDPEYELLKKVCEAEGVNEIHIIRPSLKSTTSEKGECKAGSMNGRSYSESLKHVSSRSVEGDRKYAKRFNDSHEQNLGRLEDYEATESRESFFSQFDGLAEGPEIDAALQVAQRDSNAIEIAMTKLTYKTITTTLGGKSISKDSLSQVIDLFSDHPIIQNLKISLSNRESLTKDPTLASNFLGALQAARRYAAKGPEGEKSAKIEFAKAIHILQMADISSRLKNPETRRQAALRLAVELHLKGGAARADQSVIYFDFHGKRNFIFQHNIPFQKAYKDLLDGKATVSISRTGSSISIQSEDGSTVSMKTNFDSGDMGTSIVKLNRQAVDRGRVESSELPMIIPKGKTLKTSDAPVKSGSKSKFTESNFNNKKLQLLEQIIENQRQLLLKLIDEPKIVSSD